MATKKDLIVAIHAIDEDYDVDGLKHAELVDVLELLNDSQADEPEVSDSEPVAAPSEPVAAPSEPVAAPSDSGSRKVAKGVAITTRKGVKGEGSDISADMLAGGADAFGALVDAGKLV